MEEGYNKNQLKSHMFIIQTTIEVGEVRQIFKVNKCNNNIITIYLDNFKSNNNTNRLWCLGMTMMYNNYGG